MREGVYVRNLAEVQRAFTRANRTAGRALNAALRRMAKHAADEARARAPADTGRLRQSIRPFARRGAVGVRVTATDPRTGFAYPRRLEYEPAPRGQMYLRPAVAEVIDQTDDVLELIAEAIEDAWVRGSL